MSLESIETKAVNFMEKAKSTKFVICLLSIIISTTVLCTGYVPPSTFSDLMQFTLGAYVLGNGFQNSKWSK